MARVKRGVHAKKKHKAVGTQGVAEEGKADGKFDNTPFVGTLANGGVGLAPFHDYASKVNPDLQSQLFAITKVINDCSN